MAGGEGVQGVWAGWHVRTRESGRRGGGWSACSGRNG